ncbi:protein DBF4 homolog B [Echeneis naucrates]|uniref:protein DBF4 homolog B n=1 Tax=Echeneis naucrates TaxID=173247 RepID=UPI0011145279|nr:protein DBF4 homolog B-like [Echeneis naucrates]
MHRQKYSEERGFLGKLYPGEKILEGKVFYLDNVKKCPTALLLEAICLLGGRVESFLHKDVNFVVTGSQEGLKKERCVGNKEGTSEEAQHPLKGRKSLLSSEKQRPETPRPMVCGSRGKALLEKAICNNERLRGSSVLANARSWGVKILYVDDVLIYLKQLTREGFSMKHRKSERPCTKQGPHVVKAAALKSPFLKIEDSSKKYKPLHMQSMTFPSLCYLGRFSPFEIPPPQFENTQHKEQARGKKKVENSLQENSQTPLDCNPSPWRPHKKDTSYCECCHQPFTNLEEHLQSDQHRSFVLDSSNYSGVDQLVAEMLPGFNPNPPQQSDETLNRPSTPLSIQDVCELEPLTDGETECAVQALRRQESSFNTHIASPIRGPDNLSARVQFPNLNPETPPVSIQYFTPTKCQFTDIQANASSPVMPVLDVEPQAHTSASQPLFPLPENPCPSPDPYSLPPVLSPQFPCSSYILNSLYSEPPVLSPQPYITEEAVEGVNREMDTSESVSESVSSATVTSVISHPTLVAVANAEEVKAPNQDVILVNRERNSLECHKLLLCRSRSLPQPSTTEPNSKKRCRSASPECSRRKRRKIKGKFNSDFGVTEGHESKKPESDIIAKPEGCLSDKASFHIQGSPHQREASICVVETLNLKQSFTTVCIPTVQSLNSSQMDILGHDSASVAAFSKTKTSDPPLPFPKDNYPSVYSNQDTQHSLLHSTSLCIDSALIPDLATHSSSDSDWDCGLLSRLDGTSATPMPPTEKDDKAELDKELLHQSCTWMHDTSYESRLHNVLQPSTPATSSCGEEMDPSVFSRTVVQIVEIW